MTGTKKPLVILQPRDVSLLRALALLVFIDREQAIKIAGFHSVTRANARLLLLFQAGFLTRRFVGTIAGGRRAVYSLSQQGALAAGIDPTTLKRAGNIRQGEIYFEHQLAVNDLFLLLRYPTGDPPKLELLRWETFAKPIVPGLALIPDAYTEVKCVAGQYCCFVEVDLGTETRKVWQKKVDAYFQLALSGSFQRVFQRPQFRVLVLTTSARRIRNLQAVIAKRTDKLFFLTEVSSIYQQGVLAEIWFRPTGEQRQKF